MPRHLKSLIESIGVYLPPNHVSTADIVRGCKNELRMPLERLTGIRARHMAGKDEFSIDLAAKAIEDCLRHSQTDPGDFELLICSNISRYDGLRRVSYEPSTAVTLKKRFGFRRAVAMDLSNACAGTWTAVYLMDALIRTGAIGRGLVVSGEYITYLTDTAQREIVDYLDPQLASLTLGDAGIALEMRLSPSPAVGFHDIELYTLGKYSKDCIAKPSSQAHGGAAMYTDAVKVSAAVVPHAAMHVEEVLRRNEKSLAQYHHIIPHQTSRLTMQDALKAVSNRYSIDLVPRLINNLAERGNTATTSHFLALRDSILNERIDSGDDILFLISGSGQTTGTALYTCDDLPNRLRLKESVSGQASSPLIQGETLSVPMQMESLAVVAPERGRRAETLPLLKAAAGMCLEQSQYSKEEIDVLISVGVFRTEFLTEPAIAALLAGELEMNDTREPQDEHKTLAFDILNGSLGFLNACYLVAELARAGSLERAMIVASEVENNAETLPQHLLGLRELGTAAILHESEDGETGFQAFGFYHFPEHADAHISFVTWNELGRAYLTRTRSADVEQLYLEDIAKSVELFLKEQQRETWEIRWLIPPQVSPAFVQAVRQRLGYSAEDTIDVSHPGEDLATSSTPVAMQALLENGLARKGDLGLIVNIAAGLQVACALYQF